MKVFAVLVILSVLIPSIFSGDIWNSVPGNSDEEKASFLFIGVATARNWLASQLCTTQYFQSPTPDDYTTNQNWGSFLCTQWGGPAGQLPNCSYYYQNVRTNASLQILPTQLPGLMKSIHFYQGAGLGYPLNDIQFNMTRDALVQAILVAGTGTGAFSLAATNDLESLRSSIVTGDTVPCPTATHTVNWKNPTSAGTLNVSPGQFINWVWSDASQHSVNYLSGGGTGFAFVGFGADDATLSATTSCTASGIATTAPCVLLNNGQFSYAYQFNTPCQTITYDCEIHGNAMSGTVVVGPAVNTTCKGVTTSGFVGSTTTTTGSGDGQTTAGGTTTGSGAKLFSWMGLF